MLSRFASVAVLLIFVTSADALDVGRIVTKDTQKKMGLDFELSAVQEETHAVVVKFSVAKAGKLKDLHLVRLEIHDGKKYLAMVPLEMTLQPDGSHQVLFQLLPELADKTFIALYTEMPGQTLGTHYRVRLKEYIVSKK